jgi:hypothetical protein
MKPLPATPELLSVAERVVWFKAPPKLWPTRCISWRM